MRIFLNFQLLLRHQRNIVEKMGYTFDHIREDFYPILLKLTQQGINPLSRNVA